MNPSADVIGGFPYVEANCKECGKPLTVENAWMTDGCPCNSPLGVNSLNETRWRLLMQLQQRQAAAAQRTIQALAEALDDCDRRMQGLLDEIALCRGAKSQEPLMIAVSEAETARQAARTALDEARKGGWIK